MVALKNKTTKMNSKSFFMRLDLARAISSHQRFDSTNVDYLQI
jgi:hypothetical protein